MLEFAPYLLPNMFKDLLVSQFPLKASSWTENKFFFFLFYTLESSERNREEKETGLHGKKK